MRGRAAALLVLLALVAVAAIASAGIAGTPPPADGDWLVDGDTTVSGEEVVLPGDLVVLPTYRLTLSGAAIVFSGVGDHSLIVEEGATLVMEASSVSAAPGASYEFHVRGSAVISGSDVSGMAGGIQAHSDGLLLQGTRVHHGTGPGLELWGHDATVAGCTFDFLDVGISSIDTGSDLDDEVAATDGWSLSLSDTTLSAKSYGVYLYWKKTLTGALDLDFIANLNNVNITRSTYSGVHCYVDLYVNGGTGALDELFDLTWTGGSSTQNGVSGVYIYHYIKPYKLNANVVSENRVTLTGVTITGNSAEGVYLEDTLYQDQGSGSSTTHKQSMKLTDCKVSSNGKSGIYLLRPRTLYYCTGTGAKTRNNELVLTNTEVKSNGIYGVYIYDNHYSYSTRGKFVWYNYLTLKGATISGNSQDGVYYLLYERLYYGDKTGVDYRNYFDFQDSTLGKNGRNGFDLQTSGYMYYHGTMGFRNDLKILRCRIHNNTAMGGYTYFYMYGYDWQYTFSLNGQYTMTGNRVEDNQAGGVHARTYGYSYLQSTDVPLRCSDNVVLNNGADRALGFEGMSGNKGEALVENNLFKGNGGGGGTTCLDLVYFNQFVVAGNVWRDDDHRTLVRCYANGMNTPSPNLGKYNDWIQVYENTFEDSATGTSATEGAVVIDTSSGTGSMLVRDNVMRNLDGNGVTTSKAQGKGTLTVTKNLFDGLGGSGVQVANSYSGAKTTVKDNVMVNGTGSTQSAVVLIRDDGGSTVTVTGNEGTASSCSGVVSTGSTGPGSLTVKDNRLVGLGGNAIDLVGNKFDVEDNNLSDCKGFAIALRGFTQLPSVGANIILRAENGLLLEAKERTDGLRLRIYMDNVTWSVNETAIQVKNLDLVVSNSTLLGRKALYASHGTLTAISTNVPYMSGGAGPEGVVEVYYRVAINLTWANASGVDSGLPAGDALVVFKKSTGGYQHSRIADSRGHLPFELIPSWRVVEGFADRISPYNLEITASGLTTHATLDVDEDGLTFVKVVDWALPLISIEKPYDGALVNTADLTVKGFLQERGSGFDGAWVSLDGETWREVQPQQIWECRFEGLEHGSARVYAKARDRSGNVNVTHVDFLLDLMGPDLDVLRPLDGTQTQEREVIVEASTERTAELFLDGEPVMNRQGQMFERRTLTQGLNIIVVEAVDESGNAAIQVLHVWHDTVAPALFVSSPKDHDVAPEALVLVRGRTEPTANVTVNDVFATVGSDGWFALSYVLTTRENLLIIESTDQAGNVNVSYRLVTLDDRPPAFTVSSPKDGTLTSETEVTVVGSVSNDDLDAAIYVDGERVVQAGRFTASVVLLEGENRIEVRAVDPNGRESVTIVRVIRDTQPPIIALSSPSTTDVVTREGTLMIAGVAETATYIAINQRPDVISVDGSFMIDHQLDAGPNTIEVEVRDEAGNADVLVLNVEWDSSPPDLRMDSLPQRTREEVIVLNGSTEGVTVTVDGVPVPITDGLFTVPVHLEMGHNSIDVVAFDAAGNAASHQVQVDREERLGEMQASPWTDNVWSILPIIVAVIAIAVTVVITRARPQARPPFPNGGPRRNGRPNGNGNGGASTARPPTVEAGIEAAPAASREAWGVSARHEMEAGTTDPLETLTEDIVLEVPDLPPVHRDPMVASSHTGILPADETAYDGPMHREEEPRVWTPPEPLALPEVELEPTPVAGTPVPAPKLELEFAPLPLYSVADPHTVNGAVSVNGNGEMSYERPEPAPEPVVAPEPEPAPVIVPTPAPSRVVDMGDVPLWKPPETKTATPKAEEAPVVPRAPEPRAEPAPMAEPAPEPTKPKAVEMGDVPLWRPPETKAAASKVEETPSIPRVSEPKVVVEPAPAPTEPKAVEMEDVPLWKPPETKAAAPRVEEAPAVRREPEPEAKPRPGRFFEPRPMTTVTATTPKATDIRQAARTVPSRPAQRIETVTRPQMAPAGATRSVSRLEKAIPTMSPSPTPSPAPRAVPSPTASTAPRPTATPAPRPSQVAPRPMPSPAPRPVSAPRPAPAPRPVPAPVRKTETPDAPKPSSKSRYFTNNGGDRPKVEVERAPSAPATQVAPSAPATPVTPARPAEAPQEELPPQKRDVPSLASRTIDELLDDLENLDILEDDQD